MPVTACRASSVTGRSTSSSRSAARDSRRACSPSNGSACSMRCISTIQLRSSLRASPVLAASMAPSWASSTAVIT
ncbi:Uncharacterised protein [Bordetella pertussis]|nr:Uncharacterised protein [Bordetella pertussis]